MMDIDRARMAGSGYWFSLIAAAPAPETGESVNVGVLFGNGHAYQLRYLEHLPRLSGIAAVDEINVYEAVLAGVAETVSRGVDVALVASLIAPQMQLREPRALYKQPSEALFERIADRFLRQPTQPPRVISVEALIRRSIAKLDEELAQVKTKGVHIAKRVKPSNFYEGKLDRFVPFRVPQIARAMRGFSGRDVLIDGLVVEEGQDPAALRSAVTRIGQAFFAYDRKLKPIIKQWANRDIRTVGILQPGRPDDSNDVLAMREYIKDAWSHHAIVVDGNQEDVVAALRTQAEWVSADSAA